MYEKHDPLSFRPVTYMFCFFPSHTLYNIHQFFFRKKVVKAEGKKLKSSLLNPLSIYLLQNKKKITEDRGTLNRSTVRQATDLVFELPRVRSSSSDAHSSWIISPSHGFTNPVAVSVPLLLLPNSNSSEPPSDI